MAAAGAEQPTAKGNGDSAGQTATTIAPSAAIVASESTLLRQEKRRCTSATAPVARASGVAGSDDEAGLPDWARNISDEEESDLELESDDDSAKVLELGTEQRKVASTDWASQGNGGVRGADTSAVDPPRDIQAALVADHTRQGSIMASVTSNSQNIPVSTEIPRQESLSADEDNDREEELLVSREDRGPLQGQSIPITVCWGKIEKVTTEGEKLPLKAAIEENGRRRWLSSEQRLEQLFLKHASEEAQIVKQNLLPLLMEMRLNTVNTFNAELQKIEEVDVDVKSIISDFGDSAGLSFEQFKAYKRSRKRTVYPKQEHMAHNLFHRIESVALKVNAPLHNYTDFSFLILVPDLNSLLSQTVTRVREFFDSYAHYFTNGLFKRYCTDMSTDGTGTRFADLPLMVKRERYETAETNIEKDLVCKKMSNIRETDLQRFSTLQEQIAKNPSTLYLIIHDEAHFGSTYGGAADILLHGNAKVQLADAIEQQRAEIDVKFRKHYQISTDRLAARSNVVVLNVSATPFNLISQQTQIPRDNELKWEDAPGYYGQEEYTRMRMQNAGADVPGSLNGADSCFLERVEALKKETYYPHSIVKLSKATKLKPNAESYARVHALTEQYVAALLNNVNPETGRFEKDRQLSQTETMVRHLIEDPFKSEDGSGIMIVIRQPDRLGNGIADSLLKARDQLGLQRRFAVVIDLQTRQNGISGYMKLKNSHMLEVMAERSGLSTDDCARTLSSYEDLDGVPIILILCEKGKMGDSFPPSFRYYDLRLRYPNQPLGRAAIVQDLGRAFGYNTEAHAPVIFVGQGCIAALKEKRGRPSGILGIDPDYAAKLKPSDGKTKTDRYIWPNAEFDLDPYRENWQARQDNVDWHGHPSCPDGQCADWCNQSQHFLMFGRPQIGKTGAFLHLVYLLYRSICGEAIDVQGLEMHSASESEEDDDSANMGAWPVFSELRNLPFKKSANPGKYGDPADESTWDWYVTKHRLPYPPNATKMTTAAAETLSVAQSAHTARTHTGCQEKVSVAAKQAHCLHSSKWHARPFEVECSFEGYEKLVAGQELGNEFILWVPKTDPRTGINPKAFWFETDGSSILSLKRLDHQTTHESVLSTPIFMPSSGRHGQDGGNKGLLDLSDMIRQRHFLQIVAVKEKEVEDYKRLICGRAIIFQLPRSAIGCQCSPGPCVDPQSLSQGCFGETLGCDEGSLGIGCSRYHMQGLAEDLLGLRSGQDARRPFVFMMDDTTKCFKGLALKHDEKYLPGPPEGPVCLAPFGRKPEPPIRFGGLATVGKFVSTSLGDVLSHFLDDSQKTEIDQFGAIGFYRFNGTTNFNAAYARKHVYSAVLWNVALLRSSKLNFNKKLWLWEDIEFNRRVSEAGVVLCKCNRFHQFKVQIPNGGCSAAVARNKLDDEQNRVVQLIFKGDKEPFCTLPRDTLPPDSFGPLPNEKLLVQPSIAQFEGTLTVDEVNGEPVAEVSDIKEFEFQQQWQHVNSLTLSRAQESISASHKELSSLNSEEVSQFVETVLKRPIFKVPDQMAHETALKFKEAMVTGEELLDYTFEDFNGNPFLLPGNRARHLQSMVKKAQDNGLGPDLSPL